MQPEFSASMFQSHFSSPSRKRMRDEPSTLAEFDLDLMTTTWDATSSTTFTRPFSSTQYQVHGTSKPSTLKLKHRIPRVATTPSIQKPNPDHHAQASPRQKRSRLFLTTSGRSRSPSPFSHSLEMHLSPEFTSESPQTKITNPIKSPAVQGQRCHICSRMQLLISSALVIKSCELCDQSTCGVCARECTSCDERVCRKCCREKGDFTFCVSCWGIMELRGKSGGLNPGQPLE